MDEKEKKKLLNNKYILDILESLDDSVQAFVFPNGTEWYRDRKGKPHREHDRPAIRFRNGTLEWYQHGKKHRDKGPAVIKRTAVDKAELIWYTYGVMSSCTKTSYLKALRLYYPEGLLDSKIKDILRAKPIS